MSEYSPEQRKEPYAFGHLEIEFDWPEDESPEQERRLNEAVKQIMRYINRSDSNKMGEAMIDSEERAMERRLLTNRSARRLRDLTDHMERHLHRLHMERGARERVTKQLIDELQMEDGCEGWKDWRTTSRELSRYDTANRIFPENTREDYIARSEIINALDIAPDNESDRSTPSFTILNNNSDVEEVGEVTFIEERRSNEKKDEEKDKENNKDIDLVATAMQISRI